MSIGRAPGSVLLVRVALFVHVCCIFGSISTSAPLRNRAVAKVALPEFRVHRFVSGWIHTGTVPSFSLSCEATLGRASCSIMSSGRLGWTARRISTAQILLWSKGKGGAGSAEGDFVRSAAIESWLSCPKVLLALRELAWFGLWLERAAGLVRR